MTGAVRPTPATRGWHGSTTTPSVPMRLSARALAAAGSGSVGRVIVRNSGTSLAGGLPRSATWRSEGGLLVASHPAGEAGPR